MNQADGNLTLEKLVLAMENLPQPRNFPPYYRCHPATYQQLVRSLPEARPTPEWFPAHLVGGLGFSVKEDTDVPIGEFLPPEGWNADASKSAR